MPRYYFNIYNDDVTLDDEGVEIADALAARAYAIEGARSLAADTVLRGHLNGDDRIEIVDKDQNRIDTVRFRDAVEIRP